MHFGRVNIKALVVLCSVSSILLISSCNKNTNGGSYLSFKLPEQGQTFKVGDPVKIELDIPKGEKLTGVSYLLDGKPVGNKDSSEPLVLQTTGLSVGYKLITAIIDTENKKDTATINIVLNAANKPQDYSYKVVNVYPHDTTSYTQGLEFHEGRFLESTGEKGSSTLRWVDLASGKALQRINLDNQYFGEGATLVGDKIAMLTWQENIGFVFDARTLKQLSTFPYKNSREGWGLCFDGRRLIKSDGTNRLYFLNKDTFEEESMIDVYDDKGAVEYINELEYIDGKIYANIYQQDYIVVIDPGTGVVEKKINLSGLLAKGYFKNDNEAANDVLNGIAWDNKGKRLFVTGKKWPKLFEITLVPQ
ncbi:glutaminyl-peptide cyclotransferase [Pedobacter metabolipauper]|uniref:Glutamine cyclotransferase n=1 Tax=Pedobacter metabolipauper TaxID=425513 RepID=A0A4R6SQP6_9SPHI|nr:glutaminyl-peptide cyclotransferase [Pedobacter metabolipauper]TDQ06558.1 glutamine cyclotransferase [Pedobacter metabolipauper]